MKTSLVCLLLLAAVACAAPKAKEAEMARIVPAAAQRMGGMRKMAERADGKTAMAERAEELSGFVPQAGEAEEAAVAAGTDLAAGVEGEGEERLLFGCWGPCFSLFGGFGCYFDGCFSPIDVLYYKGFCACCAVASLFQCF